MTASDRGPLLAWDVVWRDGRTETVWAHQCIGPALLGDDPLVRFHGEVNGHWQLVLSAAAKDIASIRNVSAAPPPPRVPAVPKHAKPAPGNADEVRALKAQCAWRRITPRDGQTLADALGERMDRHIADAVSAQMKLEGKLPLARVTYTYDRKGRRIEKEVRL